MPPRRAAAKAADENMKDAPVNGDAKPAGKSRHPCKSIMGSFMINEAIAAKRVAKKTEEARVNGVTKAPAKKAAAPKPVGKQFVSPMRIAIANFPSSNATQTRSGKAEEGGIRGRERKRVTSA